MDITVTIKVQDGYLCDESLKLWENRPEINFLPHAFYIVHHSFCNIMPIGFILLLMRLTLRRFSALFHDIVYKFDFSISR